MYFVAALLVFRQFVAFCAAADCFFTIVGTCLITASIIYQLTRWNFFTFFGICFSNSESIVTSAQSFISFLVADLIAASLSWLLANVHWFARFSIFLEFVINRNTRTHCF